MIINICSLQALNFDKVHRKVGKRVVAKEMPRIATEHHVVLSFNLQAVYGHFPAQVACGSRRWCVEVVGGVYKSYVVCGSHRVCVKFVGGVWKSYMWCVQVVGGVNKSWVV